MNTFIEYRSSRIRNGLVLLAVTVLGCGAMDGPHQPSPDDANGSANATLQLSTPQVNCANLTVTGSAASESGATWTYVSVDGGVSFRLSGTLVAPAGSGPFPAAVVNHGTGGSPRAGNATFEFMKAMRSWGGVAIGSFYTHARVDRVGGSSQGAEHLPSCSPPCPVTELACQSRCFGASPPNLARAQKTRDLLSCLQAKIGKTVDLGRVVSHGHSRGAFLTGEVVGTFPMDYRAASHTAGGAAPPSTNPDRTTLTNNSVARQIVTPYSIHHSPDDDVVLLSDDQRLRDILASNQVQHELRTDYLYGAPNDSDEGPGQDNDHPGTATDPIMLSRVQSWYRQHGVLPLP